MANQAYLLRLLDVLCEADGLEGCRGGQHTRIPQIPHRLQSAYTRSAHNQYVYVYNQSIYIYI